MFNKLIIVLFVASLFGCAGTIEGMGDDIEKMGKSIKESMSSDKKDADKK